MRTYIINLARSKERRVYMERLLAIFPSLITEFIDAVDGNLLTSIQIKELFDNDYSFKLYGKQLSRGEIGCTLSHQICYKKLCESSEEYALILEDDLQINDCTISSIINYLDLYMENKKPMVLLLSGDYWWINKKKFWGKYSIVDVYDASCAQSYIINKKAAKILLSERPGFLADDWMLFSKKIKIKAVYPHLMDQNRKDFETEVKAKNIGIIRRNLSWKRNIEFYINSICKHILGKKGHFESKKFKW